MSEELTTADLDRYESELANGGWYVGDASDVLDLVKLAREALAGREMCETTKAFWLAEMIRESAVLRAERDALRERLRLAEAVCEAAKEMDCDPKRGGPAPWWIAERKFRAALAAWEAAAKPAKETP